MKGQIGILTLTLATSFVVIISAFGIFFYASITSEEADFGSETAAMAASMPEWQCSYMGQAKAGCIDLMRAERVGGEYFNVFGYSVITLEYVRDAELVAEPLYENKKQGFKEKRVHFFPVSVYDAASESFFAGNIRAEVYR
ncbi:hypothetical protein JXB11_02630 [Candidatus Woesearchaeota archaeon]|nr:hypothetical protein [Candidatus Woesearchaeota archaeon]